MYPMSYWNSCPMSNVQNLIHLHLHLPNKNIYTHNVTINENLLHFPIFYMLDKVNVNSKKIGNVSVNHLYFFTQCFYLYLHLPSQNWSTIQKPIANKTFCPIHIGSISKKILVYVCHNMTKFLEYFIKWVIWISKICNTNIWINNFPRCH
jgi:hypothetical protein